MNKKDCMNWIISNKYNPKNGWNKITPDKFYRVIRMFSEHYKCSYKRAYFEYMNYIFNTNF